MIKQIYPLSQAIEEVAAKFGDKVLSVQGEESEHVLQVESVILTDIAQELKDAGFNHLSFVTAVDNSDTFSLVYALFSTFGKDRILLKMDVGKDQPEVDSVTSYWRGANWHEREVFDLFGIKFAGHPDLRRILLADDWEGYPLRKDFTHENMIRKPDYY